MDDQPKTSRPPDFNLSCLHKVTNVRGKVGVAWAGEDGSIRVVLDNFVVLPPSSDIVLTLFKNKPYEKSTGKPASNSEQLEEAVRAKTKGTKGEKPADTF